MVPAAGPPAPGAAGAGWTRSLDAHAGVWGRRPALPLPLPLPLPCARGRGGRPSRSEHRRPSLLGAADRQQTLPQHASPVLHGRPYTSCLPELRLGSSGPLSETLREHPAFPARPSPGRSRPHAPRVPRREGCGGPPPPPRPGPARPHPCRHKVPSFKSRVICTSDCACRWACLRPSRREPRVPQKALSPAGTTSNKQKALPLGRGPDGCQDTQFTERGGDSRGRSVSGPGVTLCSWPGVPAPNPRAPRCSLTGSLDLLRGFPEGLTVSPAARRAAILDSMSETWGDSRRRTDVTQCPTSAAQCRKSSCPDSPIILCVP